MSETILQQDVLDAGLEAFDEDWTLTMVLRATTDGPPLARQRVSEADLAEARSEAWLNGFLRRGQPDLPLEAVTTRLAPVVKEGRCLGFVLRAEGPGTDASVHTFGVSCLAPAAHQVSKRLVTDGLLREGDAYVYELQPQRAGETDMDPLPAAAARHDSGGMQIKTTTTALRYATRPLAQLRLTARTAGEIDDAVLPVFFTESAHKKSRDFARTGADDNPPVETGSILIGELGVCPDSGEMSVTVLDAIEVADAEQREFSLIPSSRTWSRVQAVLARLTGGDPCGTTRLVGQSHGHNFPLDGEPCALCATARECGRTTVFVSAADRSFMRTVFAGQPFALCWIAGSNARGEEVATLFTLRAGVLKPRGYYIIEDLVRS